MTGRSVRAGLLALVAAAPASAQQVPAQRDYAAAADIRAQVRAMEQEMKPDQGFAYRPLLQDGGRVAAVEVWHKPGRPAVHPDEAEYATVIEGAGTLVSGGTLADASVTRPGLTEGSRIENGTTRRLAPGDVILIPAGVPHWFGITGGRLVLLGMKVPGR